MRLVVISLLLLVLLGGAMAYTDRSYSATGLSGASSTGNVNTCYGSSYIIGVQGVVLENVTLHGSTGAGTVRVCLNGSNVANLTRVGQTATGSVTLPPSTNLSLLVCHDNSDSRFGGSNASIPYMSYVGRVQGTAGCVGAPGSTSTGGYDIAYIGLRAVTTNNLTITNAVNGSAINGLCTTIDGQTLCSNTTSITIPATITQTVYNITVVSLGTGTGGAGTYFNTTITGANISSTQNLSGTTAQAYLNVSVRQAHTNMTITSFNATNGQANNTTTSASVLLPALIGSNQVKIDHRGNYSVNGSCTGTSLTTTNCIIGGIFDSYFVLQAKQTSGASIATFSVTFKNTSGTTVATNSTTNGTINVPSVRGHQYIGQGVASGYALRNASLNTSAQINYYNFTLLETNTFNLTFRNETNDALITQNVSLQVISGAYAANFTTSNGTLSVSLPIPDEYELTYWVDAEAPRSYYVTLSPDSYVNIALYLLDADASQLYLPKVYNQNGYACSGNTVSLKRYYVIGGNTGEYRTVEMARTDTNGQAVLRVVPNTINYKLSFSGDCGNFESAPQKITSTTNSFTVSDQPTVLTSLFGMQSVTKSCSFNNDTLTFVNTWTDTNNLITSSCLSIVKKSAYRGTNDTYFSECTDGSSGSIIHTITDTNQTIYSASCSYATNTQYSTYSEAVSATFINSYNVFGKVGIFLTMLVFLVFVFLGWGRTETVVISGVGALFLMAYFGFVYYRWESIVGMLIIAGIIAYKSRT